MWSRVDRAGDRGASKGYTLLEVVIVMVLVATAAALVLPATTRAFANLELRMAAHTVATLFSQARTRALDEGRTYQIFFIGADGQTNRLILAREDGKQLNQIALPAGIVLRGELGNGQWTAQLEPVRFFPNGTSEMLQLDLANSRASHVQLSLEPLTGRVRVTQLYKGN